MSSRARLRFVGAGAVVIALAVPAIALAEGGPAARYHERDPAISAEFTVPGSNGYSLNVKSEKGLLSVVASRDRPPIATISAAGGLRRANQGNVAATTYATFGQPEDPRAIDADLGSFGRISVVFEPSGKRHVARLDLSDKTKKCVAPSRIVRQLGTFTGTISFEGENGYTRVARTSAKGSVGTSPFRNCSTKIDRRTSGPDRQALATRGGSLAVRGESRVGSLVLPSSFFAVTLDDGASFGATSSEVLDNGVFVMRTAQATAPSASFVFDDALGPARVTPPSPFFGSATYTPREAPLSPRWSGSLSVAFPGLAVPLTGRGFEAVLRPVVG